MLKLFTIALVFSLALLAQGGGGGGRALFPWWDQPLAPDLNLTDTQRTQIRALVKEYRDRLVDERAAVQKAEGNLEDIFSEDPIDQRKANEAIDRLTAARTDLTRSLAQMSLRMRSVLTEQQWQDLQRRQGRSPRGEGKSSRRRPPGGQVPPPPLGSGPPLPPSPPGKQF